MELAACHDLVSKAQGGSFISTAEYAPASLPSANEYVLFFKPELTALSRKAFGRVANLVQERLEAFEQAVVLASALGSEYIRRHRIAEEHYGVINRVSQLGRRALSSEAAERLLEVASSIDEDALGAHEFLARYPFFTPAALAVFYDNLQSKRLAPGTHCVRAVVRGRPTVIFNGFHAEQLEHYTRPGATILALVVRGTRSWVQVRRELTGATDPKKALADSIRGLLLARQHELELEEVSSGRNGIHVSAGPIEGMVEVCRYASDLDGTERLRVEDTTLGRLLLAKGVDTRIIRDASMNPVVSVSGKQTPVFDLTEELDAAVAADRLSEAVFS